MSSTAQKQDLSDPDVIEAFARRVGNLRHLTALYLLTVADIRGTSPKVWNAWKGKLLEDLYSLTKRFLTGGTTHDSFLEERQQEALRIFHLYALSENAHLPLWKHLDESYFLRHDAQEIAWHTRSLFFRAASPDPVVRTRLSLVGEGIEVMVYAPDEPHTFARICAFFERIHFTIVEAKIYTTRHGYVLDTFVVLLAEESATHYRDLLAYVEFELAQLLRTHKAPPAVSGRLQRQLKYFPLEPEISIRPDERGSYQILSVVAGDRPGLLSRIAQVFIRHQVTLHNAKIATLGSRAEDTFLVSGAVLDQTRSLIRFEQDLLEQLKT